MTDFKAVLHYIREEADSDDLRLISQECISRSRVLTTLRANKVREELEVGTRVIVSGNIKPKYFIGKVGTVVEKLPHSARVDFGERVSARFGRIVGVPYSSIKELQ